MKAAECASLIKRGVHSPREEQFHAGLSVRFGIQAATRLASANRGSGQRVATRRARLRQDARRLERRSRPAKERYPVGAITAVRDDSRRGASKGGDARG